MTRGIIMLASRFVAILAGMLLVTVCFGQGESTREIHRTPFEKEWETVRLDNIGVDIDLPKQPWFGPTRYEMLSGSRDACHINMHRFLYPGTSEAGAALRVNIRRHSAEEYRAILKENNGKLMFMQTTWDPKRAFQGIQEQHPGKRTWAFIKCYETPGSDVIVADCSYGLKDERDVRAIRRMINSVKPYR